MKPLNFPNNIQIQTTAYCNAKCNFCPYPVTSKELPMGTMQEDVYRSIIDQIAEFEDVQLVQPFLMNDPLMDKNILSRLQHMKEKIPDARVNITTNGILLRPHIIDGLVDLNLDSIHISSNGIMPETYKKTMGIDAFTVLRNVNRLHDALTQGNAKTELIVTAILMKETEEEIFIAHEYWKSRGITFFFNPLNDRAGNLEFDHFDEMLPFEKALKQQQLTNYDMSGCPSLYSFMGILYNGDLVTCCMDWRRTLILGNVKEKSLYELWHDHPYQQIRALSNQGRLCERDLCNKCGHNRFSIDSKSFEQLLLAQEEDSQLKTAENLVKVFQDDEEVIKLGLIR